MVEYKPLLDRAIELSAHCRRVRDPAAARVAGLADRGPRHRLGRRRWTAPSPAECVALEAADPLYILYTSGTTGQPKGIIRDNGGHAVAVTWSVRRGLRRRARRRVLGGVGHRLGGRPHLHRVRAAAGGLHHHPVRGQAGGHARCRRVLAGVRGARRERDLHGADGDARRSSGRIPPGRWWPATTSPGCAPVPGRRALRPRHAGVGDDGAAAARPSTTGGRPRPAGRSPPTAWGWSCWRSRPGRPACRCPATTCACWTRPASGWQPASPATSASRCRFRRGARPRCGAATSAGSTPICRATPATT